MLQDAFPVGIDGFSGPSTEIFAFSYYFQVPSSPTLQRFALDLTPALAPGDLKTEEISWKDF